VAASYASGVTDEFIEPVLVDAGGLVESGDAVIFYNFRSDRARQLTRAFVDERFDGFVRAVRPRDLHVACFAEYDPAFALPVAFPRQDLTQTLGEVIAAAGGTQLRAAETEKYPHVTYFFSGGREAPFPGEDRILVPSPGVATYDLQPEMSAPELADAVARRLEEDPPDFAVVNFANPDMVGHTGVFAAAVRAIEAVDAGTRRIVETALAEGYGITVLADHGNADRMCNPDGSPHTAHTLALVPHLIIHPAMTTPPRAGRLGDVAPTILHLMGLPVPEIMTGEVLVEGPSGPTP
jgi:2,3-bisphosphoglycerate-independent phosphoglycerate mutase